MRRIELGDEGYPAALLDLSAPPRVLWAIGDGAVLRPPVIAIVGTRKATPYGLRVTREIAGALARAGACIVSGMARGIDGMAHLAALDAHGSTVAVLGTGVDIAYPAGHRPLHARIRERGLLLSEEPPGAHAGPGSFPRRNRLIAALASITIVVEAGLKSGAKITADDALDLGRTVAAVPGPIDAPPGTVPVAGPQARALLQAVLSDVDLANDAFPFMGVRAGQFDGVPCRIARISFSGELAYEVYVPADHGAALWCALLAARHTNER